MQITVETGALADAAVDLLALPLVRSGPADRPAGAERSGRSRKATRSRKAGGSASDGSGDGPPRLPARIAALDRAVGGRISAAIASGDFEARAGQTLLLFPDTGLRARRLLLVGLGEEKSLAPDALRRAAGAAVREAAARKAAKISIAPPPLRGIRAPAAAQALAEGAVLAGYRFDRYRAAREESPGEVTAVALRYERAADSRAARPAAETGATLAECQNVARDLSNEPANELPPEALAKAAERVAREVGLRVRVIGVPELKRRKMGAILAVGQGSAHPPCLIVLEHDPRRARRGRRSARSGRGASADQAPICLIGKGITFDSGGISIKPSGGMDEMKHDMSGAAAVIGALRACALLGIPRRVVGVIAAAENMPSGTAYRPGDVVRAMSGKTIEVLNTDAEGRVVLADALHFARTEYEPVAMVDLATLTGACKVALGSLATGLFSNHERLADHLRRAGESTGERAWPLPLWEGHRKAIRSEVADIKNTGGRDAGASTAAAFLANFVGETPWAHLDIAGTGWTGNASPYQPRGATGVGVRLLLESLRDWGSVRL